MYFYMHYIFSIVENQSITWLHRIQVFSWNTSERNIHSSIRWSPWRIGRDAQDGPHTAMHIYWGLYTYNDMYCGISKICGDLISVDLVGTPHPWVNILIKLWIKIFIKALFYCISMSLHSHEPLKLHYMFITRNLEVRNCFNGIMRAMNHCWGWQNRKLSKTNYLK